MVENTVFTKASLQSMKNQKEEKRCEEAKEKYDEILYSIFKCCLTEIEYLAKEGKTEYRFAVREPSNTGFEDIEADFKDPQYILDKYFEYAVAAFPDSEVYVDRVTVPKEKRAEDRSYIRCRCDDVLMCKCYDPPPESRVCIVIDWS
jgi:hypothetical protein